MGKERVYGLLIVQGGKSQRMEGRGITYKPMSTWTNMVLLSAHEILSSGFLL